MSATLCSAIGTSLEPTACWLGSAARTAVHLGARNTVAGPGIMGELSNPTAYQPTRRPLPGDGAHPNPRASVVHVALRVPERRLVLRLRGRRGVPGADDDFVFSRCELDHRAPVPPRPTAEVVEQLRLRPGHTAVERNVDPPDVPLPARERV